MSRLRHHSLKTTVILTVFIVACINIIFIYQNLNDNTSNGSLSVKHNVINKSNNESKNSSRAATTTSTTPQTTSQGYSTKSTTPVSSPVLLNNSLIAYNSPNYGAPIQNDTTSAIVAISSSTDGSAYATLRSDGQVQTFNMTNFGSLPSLPMGDSATGIAIDSSASGYWVVTSFGQVYNFGAVPNCGSPDIPQGGWGQYPAAIGIYLAKSTPSSPNGYYVLRANGEVDGFCGANVQSSLALPYYTTAPIVATSMSVDQSTGGYWILTSENQIYDFNAPNLGSLSGTYNGNSSISIASLGDGAGYDILTANGTVYSFGTAINYGSVVSEMPDGAMATSITIDSKTGGYWTVIDWSPRSEYLNPFRSVTSLVPQEIDQGVDYCGSGPIYSIGSGTILNVYSSGWPSGIFIAYKLTSGIAAGYIVYVAENVTPKVYVGQDVTSNTVIGILNDALTCTETGWASLSGYSNGYAEAKSEYNGSNSTAYGINFSQMLEDLGSRPGLVQPDGPPGPILSSWPII